MKVQLLVVADLAGNGLIRSVNVQTAEAVLANKFICYAMLEGAKDAVRDFKPKLVQAVQVIPDMGQKKNGDG